MNNESIIGGEFFVKKSNPQNIFIPEDFNREQRMMAKTYKCVSSSIG